MWLAHPSPPLPPSRRAAAMTPGALIHVVDDDASLRESLLDLLQAAGFEGDLLAGAPVVVLVDRGSASGAEIVYFSDLNGPLLQQSQLEKVGGEAPHFCR